MTENENRVTRETLRAMRFCEKRAFLVADADAIECARATAAMTGKIEGCRYSCNADYRRNIVIIEKLPLP